MKQGEIDYGHELNLASDIDTSAGLEQKIVDQVSKSREKLWKMRAATGQLSMSAFAYLVQSTPKFWNWLIVTLVTEFVVLWLCFRTSL